MKLAAMVMCSVIAVGQPEEPKKLRYEDLPPAARLGVRVEAVRRAWPSLPFVVIVPNAGAYIEAIGRWTPRARFPVLIDDGTPAGREDIARFVRAFDGATVVRWDGTGGFVSREAIDAALRRIWSVPLDGRDSQPRLDSDAALIAQWRAAQVPRSGVVVASIEDPAWAGGMALAAGHAQPMVWIPRPTGTVGSKFNKQAAADLEREVEGACEGLGLSWRSPGDDIDAIALCMSVPGKIDADGVVLATTDVIGRLPSSGKIGSGERWAWTGQIIGSEARSVYQAMCSLFLSPKSAWLFDGYPTNEPWSKFSMKEGRAYLERVGVASETDEAPRGGERSWRLRSSGTADAGLVLVNTKGMSNEFYLEPGKCSSADVPMLSVPAMLHLVHSWSAVDPLDRGTVGGRWLERGVYSYLGSVDEPFLSAFVPSSITIGRLASKYPFAAAVRPDNGPAWKLTVIGDPLAILGPAVPRVDVPLPLPDAVSLREDVRRALKREDFDRAIRALVMLGADKDVAVLVNGLIKEGKNRLSSEGAEYSILPLFRAAEPALMVDAYSSLAPEAARRGELRDALWLYAYRALPGSRDAGLLTLLARNIRPETGARDALEIADAMSAVLGRERTLQVLRQQKELSDDRELRSQLEQAISKVR